MADGKTRAPALVVASCCLAMVSIGFATNTPPLSLTAIAADLGMSEAQSGLFLSCAFWGLVVSLLASGPLADRLGFRYLLTGSALVQGLGLLAVSLAQEPAHAYVGAAATGLGTGVVDALLTPLACAAYPRSRARVANLLHAFYPIGMLLVILMTLALRNVGWDWRDLYRLVAATNVPYGLVFLAIPLPRSSHEGDERLPGRRLLRRGAFLLFLALIFLSGMTELGPSQWLPAYVERAAGGTRSAGAVGLLMLGAMMTLGRLGTSLVARRVSAWRMVQASGALCLVSLLLAVIPAPTGFTMACLAALGLGVAGLWPTTLSLAGDRFPQAGASMYSLLHASGNLGGLVGPLAIGVIAEEHGLRLGMAVLALGPVAIVALARVGMWRHRPEPPVPPPVSPAPASTTPEEPAG